MQHKKLEYFEMLEKFIDEYKDANGGATPSLKEIARNIGIAESTVSKYLKVMREKVSSNVKAGRTLSRSRVGVTQKAFAGSPFSERSPAVFRNWLRRTSRSTSSSQWRSSVEVTSSFSAQKANQ